MAESKHCIEEMNLSHAKKPNTAGKQHDYSKCKLIKLTRRTFIENVTIM